MQDRPTAMELLEAMREFLEDEVLPDLKGRRRFHMRVVLNLLGILAREWEHEETMVRNEWARLAALLRSENQPPESASARRAAVADLNRHLASRVRRGEFDTRWVEVMTALRATVADKLRVANPLYADDDEE